MRSQAAEMGFSDRAIRTFIAGLLLGAAFICLWLASVHPAFSQDESAVEKRLTSFIRDFYGKEEHVQVKLTNIPAFAKGGKVKVKSVNFAKVPDVQGDGLCLVEVEGKDVKERSVYVAFKVYKKKVLYMLHQTLKRGDVVKEEDVAEKEAYLTGSVAYPSSRSEVVGRKVRKDLQAGTVLTPQVLEEQILVKSGDVVSIVAENQRLVVNANGKALDRGKLGETIRVKNMTSGKEILGRVTGSNTVTVEF